MSIKVIPTRYEVSGEMDQHLDVEVGDEGAGRYLVVKGEWAFNDQAELDALHAALSEIMARAKEADDA